MKSIVLKRVWLTIALFGIAISFLFNNSYQVVESNTNTFSNIIVKR